MLLPDHYVILDDRFKKLIHKNAWPDTLWTGAKWCEGPAYFPASRTLIWSDIINDRVMRWDEASGQVTTFEQPCGCHNGHAIDAEGRLISCEHRTRSVTRTEHDGTRAILASHFEGKRLNSPNDVVVKSDGSIWFTDPTYGIDSHYEGDKADSEIGAANVYRIDPDGSMACVVDDMVRPNGLAFSPDESRLYVADTGQSHDPDCTPKLRVYPVMGKQLGAGRLFCECTYGVFDGFRVDRSGHIWSSSGEGIHCIHPDGSLLGKILLPEVISNVQFGGPKRNRLFATGRSALYAIYVNAQGILATDHLG